MEAVTVFTPIILEDQAREALHPSQLQGEGGWLITPIVSYLLPPPLPLFAVASKLYGDFRGLSSLN